MHLETERLILREMVPNYFDALFQILSDPETMQHYPKPFDEEKVRSWIEWNRENYRVFGFGLWAVEHKEIHEVIGDCGVTMQNIGGKIKPEIGYHIRKDFWRKGYAKEASAICRDWIFKHTPFQTMYSYMKYTNVGSYSTAISNGMHLVDEFEDDTNTITKVYAITRRQWLELQEW